MPILGLIFGGIVLVAVGFGVREQWHERKGGRDHWRSEINEMNMRGWPRDWWPR